jgi:hypothetical protein
MLFFRENCSIFLLQWDTSARRPASPQTPVEGGVQHRKVCNQRNYGPAIGIQIYADETLPQDEMVVFRYSVLIWPAQRPIHQIAAV